MTPGELVTRVLAYTDNVASTDADYRPRRRRILAWLQEIFDEVWQESDWAWKRSNATITVAADEYEATLPVDFGNIPSSGGLFEGESRYEDVSQYWTTGGRQGSILPPTYTYSLYNYSTTSQLPTIQFPSVGPRTLTLYYNRKPPQLADKLHAPTAANGVAGNVNGAVRYLVVPITEDGYAQEPSDSLSHTAVSHQVTVTFPDPGPAGQHNVYKFDTYRTIAGGTTTYYKMNGVLDYLFGIDTTFIDNNSDASVLAQPLVFTTLTASNVLNQIPSQYHHTVLLPGVISRTRRSKGDTRNWEKDYREGLAKMIAQERQRKSTLQRMPRAISGMW